MSQIDSPYYSVSQIDSSFGVNLGISNWLTYWVNRTYLLFSVHAERVLRGHFCMSLCSFGPPSRALVVIPWRGVGCRYMMRLGKNCKKGATTENRRTGFEYMGYGVYVDDSVCAIWLDMTTPTWWREKVMIYYYYNHYYNNNWSQYLMKN